MSRAAEGGFSSISSENMRNLEGMAEITMGVHTIIRYTKWIKIPHTTISMNQGKMAGPGTVEFAVE